MRQNEKQYHEMVLFEEKAPPAQSLDKRISAEIIHFFGFREQPFSAAPNPRFMFITERHRRTLAKLMYSVAERQGLSIWEIFIERKGKDRQCIRWGMLHALWAGRFIVSSPPHLRHHLNVLPHRSCSFIALSGSCHRSMAEEDDLFWAEGEKWRSLLLAALSPLVFPLFLCERGWGEERAGQIATALSYFTPYTTVRFPGSISDFYELHGL
jgi:hypothetical protein